MQTRFTPWRDSPVTGLYGFTVSMAGPTWKEDFATVVAWCAERYGTMSDLNAFGSDNGRWCARYETVIFRNPIDALAFEQKWR